MFLYTILYNFITMACLSHFSVFTGLYTIILYTDCHNFLFILLLTLFTGLYILGLVLSINKFKTMNKYQASLFAPDGDMVTDFRDSDSVEEVWDRVNDMGSRWVFYPIAFVSTDKTIIETPEGLEFLKGKRIKTVQKLFRLEWETRKDDMCKVINEGLPLFFLLNN